MRARVLRLTQFGSAEARTDNDLLVVFTVPAGCDVRLNDCLEFHDLRLDSKTLVANLTRQTSFTVDIAAADIHDLRLTAGHGSSRKPSQARLRDT